MLLAFWAAFEIPSDGCQAVDGYRNLAIASQLGQTVDLRFTKDRVGNQNVVEPAGSHNNRLARFRDRHAMAARPDLHLRDSGILCVLVCGRTFKPCLWA